MMNTGKTNEKKDSQANCLGVLTGPVWCPLSLMASSSQLKNKTSGRVARRIFDYNQSAHNLRGHAEGLIE
jgi:hypothetical protein